FFDANTYSVLYDVTPPRLHASCSSAMITTGFAVGALAPVLLGALKTQMGSLQGAFSILGIIWVVCGALMIVTANSRYQKDYDKINKTDD
ncbi:MAG: MFS transporter, partial [Bacteroidales bacterium]|nr:MFS transporter [Bacteroidales bacterium]